MHTIFEIQNEERIIILLFLQRQNYRCAERCKQISWGLVFVGLLSVFISYYTPELKWILPWAVVVSYLSLGVDWIYSRKIRVAAASKAYMDDTLFHFREKEKYEGFCVEEIYTFAEKMKDRDIESYLVQTLNTGTDIPPGLLDWYSKFEHENENRVFFECQKENLWWNSQLSKWYILLIIVTVAFVVVAIVGTSCMFGLSVRNIVSLFFQASALFIKAGREYLEYKDFRDFNLKANGKKEMIEDKHIVKMDLIKLQDEINAIRKTGFIVPDYIHKRFAKQMHRQIQKVRAFKG
jgi:hypothetical protein